LLSIEVNSVETERSRKPKFQKNFIKNGTLTAVGEQRVPNSTSNSNMMERPKSTKMRIFASRKK
jgi:hypothetical protein